MEKSYLIDLKKLYSNVESEILIDEKVEFDPSYFTTIDLLDLKNIYVKGRLSREIESEIDIVLEVSGDMILEDAISLEPISYPFSIKIDEKLEENSEKLENTLDLREFLWENIVLEIPLKFTKVTDLSEFHGDGWKLVSEDDLPKKENPFSELLKDFGEEWFYVKVRYSVICCTIP